MTRTDTRRNKYSKAGLHPMLSTQFVRLYPAHNLLIGKTLMLGASRGSACARAWRCDPRATKPQRHQPAPFTVRAVMDLIPLPLQSRRFHTVITIVRAVSWFVHSCIRTRPWGIHIFECLYGRIFWHTHTQRARSCAIALRHTWTIHPG